MLPRDLKAEQFRSYAPEATKLAAQYLAVLQRLPLSFVPNLLREIASYDYKFPAERDSLQKELRTLSALSPEQLNDWFAGLAQTRLTQLLEHPAWVSSAAQLVEKLSADQWA